MNASDLPEGEPVTYAVRLRERATRDINAAYVRMAEEVSEAVADSWREGLYDVFASPATLPRRCPVAPERFHGEVRQRLYQRSGSQVKYRILFIITGEQQSSPEPPTVLVIHVRHAAARPITRPQIREIEAE